LVCKYWQPGLGLGGKPKVGVLNWLFQGRIKNFLPKRKVIRIGIFRQKEGRKVKKGRFIIRFGFGMGYLN